MSKDDYKSKSTRDQVMGAIRDALRAEYVTKIVVIAESFTDDGARGLWTFADEEMADWDIAGLLHYGLQTLPEGGFDEEDVDEDECD